MVFVRYLLAIALFITGFLILVQCFLEGFGAIAICSALGCFVVSYLIKPSEKQRKDNPRKSDNTIQWLDWVVFPIDFIFQLITLPFRSIGRLLKHLDIDL